MAISKIVFYGRTQVGLIALLYLLAKEKKISVIPEDNIIKNAIKIFDLEETSFDNLKDFDLFICCHGRKILPESMLIKNKFINIHPCLFKYKGHDPIKRYMHNKDTKASVESHYMEKEVDCGEIIESLFFETPVVNSYEQFYMIALPYYLDCISKTLDKVEKRREIIKKRSKGNYVPLMQR
ncbi:hypothetical protein HYX07_00620 [Candidatus Woesearchaeota archaeon]|nr:hypothetical protein [Candidatus Woesearchaeota archaeon]